MSPCRQGGTMVKHHLGLPLVGNPRDRGLVGAIFEIVGDAGPAVGSNYLPTEPPLRERRLFEIHVAERP